MTDNDKAKRGAMSLQEVADAMGISRQMVYKIEQRALKKAKTILESKGYKLSDLI